MDRGTAVHAEVPRGRRGPTGTEHGNRVGTEPRQTWGPGPGASTAVARAAGCAVLACGAAALTALLAAQALVLFTSPSDVDALVAGSAVALGVVAGAWYTFAGALAALAWSARAAGRAWTSGERALRRWGPPALRGALGLGVAATMSAGVLLSPAAVAAPPTESATSPVAVAPEAPPADVGYVPSDDLAPPVAAPAPAPDGTPESPRHGGATTARPTAPVAETHVVVAGDSLWRIASDHLPPGASDADIAAEWPLWYAANAATVGPDADLIHPGQVLLAPEEER